MVQSNSAARGYMVLCQLSSSSKSWLEREERIATKRQRGVYRHSRGKKKRERKNKESRERKNRKQEYQRKDKKEELEKRESDNWKRE